jgi:hypothetical protein
LSTSRNPPLDERLGEVGAAYEASALGWELSFDERRKAAGEFRALVRRLAMSSRAVEQAARVAVEADDGAAAAAVAEVPAAIRRRAAVRLLLEMPDPAALTSVLNLYQRTGATLDPYLLVHVGASGQPVPPEVWGFLAASPEPERGAMMHALLRSPSPEASDLLKRWIAQLDRGAVQALRAASRWCDLDDLRCIADGPQRVAAGLPRWLTSDLRVEAAFQLALREREADGGEGIRRLDRWADGLDAGDMPGALARLALLAWPSAVPKVAAALRSQDAHAVAIATEAASVLAAGELVEPLLDLAARVDAPIAPDGLPAGESALAVAAEITGVGGVPSVEACRRASRSLDPAARYRLGEPLTLGHLTADLTSRHDGERLRGAFNLRAITGEDHGYDPRLDFIANVEPIAAWRQRAESPSPIAAGGWLWRGRPIGTRGAAV